MKQYLLPLFLSAATLAASAAPLADNLLLESAAQSVKVTKVKTPATKPAKKLAKGISIVGNSQLKRIDNRLGLKTVKPRLNKKAPVIKAASESAALYESFEGWDGTTADWLPEGWTLQKKVTDPAQTWGVSEGIPMTTIAPSHGNYLFAINFGNDQDEWLISPSIDTQEGMTLTFTAYIDPGFLFSLENVDWEAFEFIGEPEVAATLQVMAKAEGDAEWTMLHDYADDYKGMSLAELFNLTPQGLELKNVSLGDFAGKKIQVALRYVGNDGNSMAVDEVAVGYPSLEGVAFSEPFEIQYWGFERGADMPYLNLGVATFPVFSPITWTNNTYLEDASYSWQYCDPVTTDMVDGGSEETLSVTYAPDYTSDFTKRNNLYYPPVLTATAPFAAATSVTSPYDYLQAGGRCEYVLKDGSVFEASLLPFSLLNQGITVAIVDSEKFGDATLPIFGHDSNTNKYWLDYTFAGEEPGADDDVQLDGILNFIYPSAAPLVVNGADVFAKGYMADDVEFKLSIYALDETYVFDPDVQQPVATATCLAKDFLKDDASAGRNTNLCIPFNFASPVVLKADDTTVAYIVYLTGFNSDKVEYFVPYQSYYNHPDYLCHGWITKRMRVQSDTYRFSATPLANYEGDQGEMYNAFAIGLHAEYPWLTTEATEIKLPQDGTPVNVALGSYYDSSKLSVTVPAGVEASLAGRYNECELTLEHDDSEVLAEGDVVISGPGVELTLPLSEVSGITDAITTDGTEVAGVYDLTGRRITADQMNNGIYIIKYTNGTAKKVTVK